MSLNSLLDKAISVANVAGKRQRKWWKLPSSNCRRFRSTLICRIAMRRLVLWYIGAKRAAKTTRRQSTSWSSQADVLLEQLAQLQSKREEIKKMKKCPNCGASCSVDSHFCSRCGMVLHEQSDLVPTQPQEEQPQQAEQAEQPINQEEKPLIEEKL